eukprot:scaffold99265_cov42-Attheya_sp.AAC.1
MVRHYSQHRRSGEYDDDERSQDLIVGYQGNRRNTQEVTEEESQEDECSGYESNASYRNNQESQESEVSATVSDTGEETDESQDKETPISVLRKMSVQELRMRCSAKNIVTHGKKKAELVAALVLYYDSPYTLQAEVKDLKQKLNTAHQSVSKLKTAKATQEMENCSFRKQLKGAIANKTEKEAECISLKTEIKSLHKQVNIYATNLDSQGGCIASYDHIFEENSQLTEKIKAAEIELKRLQAVEKEFRLLTKKVVEAQTLEKNRESAVEIEKLKQASRATEQAQKAKQVAEHEEHKSNLRMKEKDLASKRKHEEQTQKRDYHYDRATQSQSQHNMVTSTADVSYLQYIMHSNI